jgi:hypothetical protein
MPSPAGLISTDATTMYQQAQEAGAAPDAGIDSDTLDQLQQQKIANSISQQRAAAAKASAIRNGLSTSAADYTETNHGLQALPHIENDGD